jgi:hypothetical protein
MGINVSLLIPIPTPLRPSPINVHGGFLIPNAKFGPSSIEFVSAEGTFNVEHFQGTCTPPATNKQ